MRLFLFALALMFVTPLPAFAQDQATVVASCGSVTLTAGTQHFRTIDTNGVTCSANGRASPSVTRRQSLRQSQSRGRRSEAPHLPHPSGLCRLGAGAGAGDGRLHCGSVTLTAGTPHNVTIDANGQSCQSGASGGAGHSPQALAYLARTVGGDEGGNGANIATLIDGLVSDGVWAKLDALYVLAQQNETDAKLNLIGTNYPLTQTGGLLAKPGPRTGSVVFTAYVGFRGFSVAGSYLDTGFNPSSASSPKYTQNSASFGVWSGLLSNEPASSIGTGSLANMFTNYGATFYARVNGGVSAPTSITSGLSAGDRPDAGHVACYQNGATGGPLAGGSGAPDNADFWVGGTTAGQGFTSNTLSAAFIGASLGAAGQLALYNRLRTYMTAIGVP